MKNINLTQLTKERLSKELFEASKEGNIVKINALIKARADFNWVDTNGQTPLHLVAKNGRVEAINALIGARADFNRVDTNGQTPLHLAAKNGRVGAINALIGAKANVDQADTNGQTPLHLAAKNGHVKAINALIGAKANVDQADTNGQTPLHLAAKNGHVKAINALIGAKADFNRASNNGQTPLHAAAENGHVKAINALIRAKANVNHDGQTPLYIAAENGHVKAINALIRAKANVDQADTNGRTPLHAAAQCCQVEAINALIRAKANVNQTDNNGATPIDVTFDMYHFFDKDILVKTIKTLFLLGANIIKFETSLQDNDFPLFTETLKSITPKELAEITQQPEKIKKIQESGFYAVLKIFNLQCDNTANEAEKQSFEQQKKDFLKRVFSKQRTDYNIPNADQPKELQLDFLKFPPILKILETEKFSAENKLKIIKTIAEKSDIFKVYLNDIRKVKASAKDPQFNSSSGPISEDEKKLIFSAIFRKLNFADINHDQTLLNSLLDIILESISSKTPSLQIQPNQVLQESREVDEEIDLIDRNKDIISSPSQQLHESSDEDSEVGEAMARLEAEGVLPEQHSMSSESINLTQATQTPSTQMQPHNEPRPNCFDSLTRRLTNILTRIR